MRTGVAVVACIVLFFLTLLVTVPARFVMQFVSLPAYIQVGGVEGSIWRGEVDALLVNDIMLRDVSWRLRPWSLFSGQLAADVEIAEHLDNLLIGKGQIRVSASQLAVSDLHVEARLVDIAAYAPEPSPFPLRGDVVLTFESLVLGQSFCEQADGRVELVGGGLQVGQTWEDLGPLGATLGCDSGYLSAELNEPNTIGLSASMRANLNGASGEFQIQQSPDAPRSIRNMVSMLPAQALQPQRFSLRF